MYTIVRIDLVALDFNPSVANLCSVMTAPDFSYEEALKELNWYKDQDRRLYDVRENGECEYTAYLPNGKAKHQIAIIKAFVGRR